MPKVCIGKGMPLKPSTELSTGLGSWYFGVKPLARMLVVVCFFASFSHADEMPFDLVELTAKAEAGDPWAQVNLGAVYDHGLGGVARDPTKAIGWYRRSAEAGIPEAQFNLAHCLANGRGAPRDDAEAFIWMRRAAEQGLTDAQYLLGVMLVQGRGTAPDRVAARDWLGRAAAEGQSYAQELLEELDAESAER